MTPRLLYRIVAIAEAITWTLLIIGLILRATGMTELGVRIGGGVHGFAFLCYVLATLFAGLNLGWRRSVILVGLASAIVPWATIPFERWAERRGLLAGDWQRHGDGRLARLTGWVLRHPIPAAAIALAAVAIAFGTLLWLGPPTGWSTRFA
ncbi:DUF3817 domain-containing protein [Microlunatus speluncae]|uniref:DUF3817 domain-containing protein n=1 Tax=Microlunatus speluncae TaxID=2594267 RepID=UPI00126625EC|nr:DUF3817 domain-containing protein [Microlunatus speluncae]